MPGRKPIRVKSNQECIGETVLAVVAWLYMASAIAVAVVGIYIGIAT